MLDNMAWTLTHCLWSPCQHRKEVADLLLAFGAQPGVKNGKGESAIDIVQSHPPNKRNEFMKLFRGELNPSLTS